MVAVVAGLLAAVTTLAVLRSNQSTVQVVTAAAPIARALFGRQDFVVEEILLSPQFGAQFVTANEIDRVAGSVARRSIIPGEPLLDSDLGAVAASEGLGAMSVPIEEARPWPVGSKWAIVSTS